MRNRREIIRVADAEAMAHAAAQQLLACMATSRQVIAVCLTGGSSPQRLYQLLAANAYRSRIPWPRVHWFIGDERFVAPNDPRHNMAMARRLFLDACAPSPNVHAIPTNAGTIDDAARAYELTLQTFYGSNRLDPEQPLFDLVLMGLGPDGHTASLFPGDAALSENARWVVGVPRANVAPFVPRVTLTLPALGSCRNMLFQVSGSDKRAILARILAGEDLPAAHAHAQDRTTWLVDAEALPRETGNA